MNARSVAKWGIGLLLLSVGCATDEPGADLAQTGEGPLVVSYTEGPDGNMQATRRRISVSQYQAMHARKAAAGKGGIEGQSQALYVGRGGPGCSGSDCQNPNEICAESDLWLYNVRAGWAISDDATLNQLVISCFRGQDLDEVPKSALPVNNGQWSVWAGKHTAHLWAIETVPPSRRFSIHNIPPNGQLASAPISTSNTFINFVQQGSAPQPPALLPPPPPPPPPTPQPTTLSGVLLVASNATNCGSALFNKDGGSFFEVNGEASSVNGTPVCRFATSWFGVPPGSHTVCAQAFGQIRCGSVTTNGIPAVVTLTVP